MTPREFLIVFMYVSPAGPVYHNCWLSLIGVLNRKGIMLAAKEAGLPENVTVICIQQLET